MITHMSTNHKNNGDGPECRRAESGPLLNRGEQRPDVASEFRSRDTLVVI